MPEHPSSQPPSSPHQPTRQYIFTEAQTRLFFIGSGVLMVAALVGILLLATVRPQGQFFEPDRSVHLATLERSAEDLGGERDNGDGTVTLPIERAMELVAERGVASPFTAQAQAPEVTQPQDSLDPVLAGETLFGANCAACHQASGAGVPGAFPPLAGHMPELYNAGGRDYLVNVVLHGLQGEIEVFDQLYNGAMPGFGRLTDEEVASILNHEMTSWGNEDLVQDFAPYTPEDIAAQREDKAPAEVLELRPDLP